MRRHDGAGRDHGRSVGERVADGRLVAGAGADADAAGGTRLAGRGDRARAIARPYLSLFALRHRRDAGRAHRQASVGCRRRGGVPRRHFERIVFSCVFPVLPGGSGSLISRSAVGGAIGSTMRTLILGGARSGKSDYAEQLAAASGKDVIYIATAQVGDAEMAQRIALHRQQRPLHWHTVEQPLALGDAIAEWSAPGRVLLGDCLTLGVSNLLFAETGE